jgi:ribosomal peptide maturation radical SAM protein 1
MQYRSKSPARVLDELRELEDRYGIRSFEVVDNILDMSYYKTLLPSLAEHGGERRLFYEIKANVTRRQVEQLVAAGVTWVQPGIESLHSDVLRLMNKGTQAWKNVQLLKWARELGLRLSWSILWGFPEERDEWYAEMAGQMPYLEHLQPPSSVFRLRFDRFSIYHEQADRLGLQLRAVPAMGHIYPVAEADLDDLAYYFADHAPRADGRPPMFDGRPLEPERPGVAAVRAAVETWRSEFGADLRPVLSLIDRGEHLEILDTRAIADATWRSLAGVERLVCLACERAPGEDAVGDAVAQQFGVTCSRREIDAAVQALLEAGLALRLDRRIVGLALRSKLPPLASVSDFPGGHVEV